MVKSEATPKDDMANRVMAKFCLLRKIPVDRTQLNLPRQLLFCKII